MSLLILVKTEGTGAPGACPGPWISNYTGANNGAQVGTSPVDSWTDAAMLSDTKMIVTGNTSFTSTFQGDIYSMSDTTPTFGGNNLIDGTSQINWSKIAPVDDTLAFAVHTRGGGGGRTLFWILNISGNTITPTLRLTLNITSAGAANAGIAANASNNMVLMGWQDQGGALSAHVRGYNYTHDRFSTQITPWGGADLLGFANAADLFFMSPTRAVYVANENDSANSKRIALISVDPGDAVTNPTISALDIDRVVVSGSDGVAWATGCKLNDTDCLMVYSEGSSSTKSIFARRFSTAGDVITIYDANEVIIPDSSDELYAYRLGRLSDSEAVLIHSAKDGSFDKAATILCSSVNDVNTVTAGSEIDLSDMGDASSSHLSAHLFSDGNRLLLGGSDQNANGQIKVLKLNP